MAGRRRVIDDDESPSAVIQSLSLEALELAKKARRYRKSLSGDNHYGNKFAELKSRATEAFDELPTPSTGDTTALAELLADVFSTNLDSADRLQAQRELSSALRRLSRKAAKSPAPSASATSTTFFPPSILDETERAYIISIGRQMNSCYANGWRDACMVMMRRLLEIGIIEAFEHHGIAQKIKGADGNYFQLTKLVELAMQETAFPLSRNAKTALPKLKDIGHMSAHGRYFTARPDDVEKLQPDFRVAMEELLHHAGLQ
jgi:hypothetical protein